MVPASATVAAGSMSNKRPRVLVIAEAANPEWVSVPLVGWSITAALRQVADVHLVTQARNTEAIIRAGWVPKRDFTALDTEHLAAPMWKLVDRLRGASGVAWTLVTAMSIPSYYWFEQLLWKHFAADFRAGAWDIVHRVTPLSPVIPSLVAHRLKMLGIPFVVGPINGGVPWPPEFTQVRQKEREWLSYVRDAYRFLPGYRSTRDSAAAILVGSRVTWQQLGVRWMPKAVYLPENAVPLVRCGASATKPSPSPLRVVFVGRLVPLKGVDMLIEACASLIRSGKLHLEIVGDGPQRSDLEKMVAEQQLGQGVVFAGWLDYAGVAARLAQSHILGFPSIREFGGGVVLEAMASGTVPVVVDYAGPGELVTPSTGYLLSIAPRQPLVAKLRAQFERLVDNPGEIAAKAVSARARVERWFTWERKAEQIGEVYDWVLQCGPKPDFGMPLPD
jgi:glycosyltransferase involved in cell wall biosynthesis